MEKMKNMLTLADFERLDPVPPAALATLKKILGSANLFRYMGTVPGDSEASLLERDFAKYVGTKYALAVNSCSSAIFLSLLCAGIKPGDKVLMPAFTFTAVPSSIVHAGGIPVLLECNEDYCVDLEDFEKKAKAGAKFFVLSHMRGHTSNIDEIMKVCDQHGITVIEDAAHSLGVLWGGKPVGTFGKTGCYSFQSFKIINAGEGGMLVTNDEELLVKAIFYSGAFDRVWSHHFVESRFFEEYQNKLPIYNMRMSNASAAIVRSQIKLIKKKVKIYQRNYRYLLKSLSASPHIHIPRRDPKEHISPDSIQFGLKGVDSEQAKNFMEKVRSRGLSINVLGVHRDNARVFWNWKFLGEIPHLPMTKEILLRTCDMRLPVFFQKKHLDYVGQTIVKVLDEVLSSRSA